MKIPKMLYGTGADVHPKAKRYVSKALKAGIVPSIQDKDLMDLSDLREGNYLPRVLAQPYAGMGIHAHFRAYFLSLGHPYWTLGLDVFTTINIMFDGLVTSEWGILSILCDGTYAPRPDREPERNRLFFERLVEVWPTFIENKDVFFDPRMLRFGGGYFWQNASTDLWSIFVEKGGIPIEIIRETLAIPRDNYYVPELIHKYILK